MLLLKCFGNETVPIDESLARAIRAGCPESRVDAAAHAREHSLEVQLPFLQHLVPNMTFVPICVGTRDAEVPCGRRPIARELEPSRPSQLVEERDPRERPLRIAKRELDGVLVNPRPAHGAEDTRYSNR